MTDQSPRVVVTGLGTFNPLGTDAATSWKNALDGVSTATTLDNDWAETYGLSVDFACTVAGDPLEFLSRPEARKLDPSGQYAMIAAREAWKDAGSPEVDPLRLATVVGAGIGGVWTMLDQWDIVRERGARRVNPYTVPMLMPNSASAHIEIEFGAKAGSHTPVSACATGAESVAWGMDMIRNGRADVVITGGTDACIHPLPLAGFANIRALSTRTDDPKTASRPYDRDRDGFVLGEGAGILVLESEEFAKARGARIYAYASGRGMASDAHHISAPSPDGQQRAIREAIEDAGIDGSDLRHVNAHGTSTPLGDISELESVRDAVGAEKSDQIVVSSTKSMTGHLLGGAGAVESIFSVLALHNRVIPPTINIENLDENVPLDVAVNEPREMPEGDAAVLNNAFGFGGHDIAVVFTNA
ncbi:beta-ketoacyl-[acyl-carrier-protein] synthase II [Helcobacillus sp. ACRRO]|uniref:beta-ketoacyl-[acyl-carrier-protein] synthase family protein n=1 Tax=Helcobacillus TaxID=1161125 RepID=UPI001EF6DA08|nr:MULTISPECIES: beta-ketoacyl-[acyl-carrier-protein] synthase II [Helcobacillus]MCG7426559.1 beta-ketoacyl-[acyl-carrier-protein] synthase II [Helcobacillus sp. ACRRO]MDK7741210.1 beta-ketoacyl-[acyl-carrier-protein] synthase II [Helcobacillus massiliensis]WOO94016.1 beta-ketoacyl-[acyl-carrier-protein] synthase II [Helcobacillus massiliensis]